MNIRHFRAKNRGRRLRRRPLRCLWGFCAKAFARGLSRESPTFGPTRQSREASFSRVSFSGRSRQSSRDAARGHPSSARRRRSRTTPSSRDASFFAYLSVVLSVVPSVARRDFSSQAPASAPPPPPPQPPLRRLRPAASAAAAARVASSSRTMPASPPAALPGLPPRVSGTNQPLFPRLPPSLRLPAYPPARVSEEDALSAAAASSSRRISESETKAPGVSVRAGLRPDAAALDADACSCVETVSPPAHTDAKSLGLSFRDASPRPPYAPRDRPRARRDTAVAPAAGDARRAPGAETGAYTGPDALAVSMFRAAVAAYPGARGSLARLALLRGGDLAERGRRRRPRGRGSRSAGIPGDPGDDRAPAARRRTAPRVARRRRRRDGGVPASPRDGILQRAGEEQGEPPRATRDAAASAAARREREDEPAGPREDARMERRRFRAPSRLRDASRGSRLQPAHWIRTRNVHARVYTRVECTLAGRERRVFKGFCLRGVLFSSVSSPGATIGREPPKLFRLVRARDEPLGVRQKRRVRLVSRDARVGVESGRPRLQNPEGLGGHAGERVAAAPAKTASAFRVANRRQCAASASAPTLSANASSSNTERASQLDRANDVCASHRKEGTRKARFFFRAFVLSVRSRFVLGSKRFFSSPA